MWQQERPEIFKKEVAKQIPVSFQSSPRWQPERQIQKHEFLLIFFKWVENSYKTLTILKHTLSWYLVYPQCCATITSIWLQNIFLSPDGNRELILQSLPTPSPPSPWTPLISFLSLWVYLFWIIHINGIIQDVTFYTWLLSLTIMFSRGIPVVAWNSASFLLMVA